MNIPTLPTTAVADPGHAELTIIGLICLVGVIARMYWNERKKNLAEDDGWRIRVETKLDSAIRGHIECQKNLPFMYVPREVYRELLTERNRQWALFNEKFDKLIERFWNHQHDQNGKVDRQ